MSGMEITVFNLRNLSIRRKLQSIVMVTCGVALLLAAIVFTIYDRITFLHSSADGLATTADTTGHNSTTPLPLGSVTSPPETLPPLLPRHPIVLACLSATSA